MTPPQLTAELEDTLGLFKRAGRLVLTVDSATMPQHVEYACAKPEAKGYVPFVAVRELDQLTVYSGYEPD